MEQAVFRGTLADLYQTVNEMGIQFSIPSSHEIPCKFFCAYWVLCGVSGNIPIVHGPEGCAFNAKELRHFNAAYCGQPYEFTGCTGVEQHHVIFGAEARLEQAIKQIAREQSPGLITVLTTCSSGIIGDDVEAVVDGVADEVSCPIVVVRCEGFGGDFRSGYEDGYQALFSVMERGPIQRGKVNILGARRGPDPVAGSGEFDEIARLLKGIGLEVNAVIAGSCSVEQLITAPQVEANVCWCSDLGLRLGNMMEREFGTPFASYGMPYGRAATRDYLLEVADLTGRREIAEAFIAEEEQRIRREWEQTRAITEGKTAIIALGPIRAIHLSRFLSEDLGMTVYIHNLHPYQLKERRGIIEAFLARGINPGVVVTEGAFTFGSYQALVQEERDMADLLGSDPESTLFFGSSYQFPGVPLVHVDNQESFPHVGYEGFLNICLFIRRAVQDFSRPRSSLFRRVMYDV